MIIYSKPACPACDALKMKMTQRGIPHKVMVLGVDYDVEELVDLFTLHGKGAPRSFPIVLKDGQLIVGPDLNNL